MLSAGTAAQSTSNKRRGAIHRVTARVAVAVVLARGAHRSSVVLLLGCDGVGRSGSLCLRSIVMLLLCLAWVVLPVGLPSAMICVLLREGAMHVGWVLAALRPMHAPCVRREGRLVVRWKGYLVVAAKSVPWSWWVVRVEGRSVAC